ncbi:MULTISPECIES: prepilin peptidase [Rhodomicrobium]|uniref:prepilin peptidase n=1 Tax=Rhodomicrobium TaxID=1068 RepID=UPI000B4B87F8|nr:MULTISPECIES: prepilin peptidase [Rhodomicrobium]
MLADEGAQRGPGWRAALLGAPIGASILALSFALLDPAPALASCLLAAAMAAIAISDARNFIVPDILSLPAIPAGLLATGWLGVPPDDAIAEHLGAALVAAFALFALRWAYAALRGREGLGLGDVKLAAVAGAWSGFAGLPTIMLLACVAAIGAVLVMKASGRAAVTAITPVPFGAFLAPAIWVVWFAQAAGFLQDAALAYAI